MPNFIPPQLNDLKEFLAHIEQTYLPGAGAIRQEQIRLLASLERLQGENARDIIIGGLVYILEEINNEYEESWLAPKDPKPSHLFGLFKRGSDLYPAVERVLALSPQNQLDDRSRFVYLRKFQDYMATLRITHPSRETKESISLCSGIQNAAKRIITRSQTMIDALLNGPPTEKSLLAKFQRLPAIYRKRCYDESNWMTGLLGHTCSREQFMRFIEILHDKAKLKSPVKQIESKEEHKDDIPELDYMSCFGFLTWNMIEIEKNWMPRNSIIYQECQSALHIQHSSELDLDFKIYCLSALQAWAAGMVTHPKEMEKWNAPDFPAKTFFNNLRNSLAAQNASLVKESGRRLPGPINAVAENVSSGAAHLGVGCGLAALFNYFVLRKLAIGSVALFVAPECAVVLAAVFLLNNPIKNVVVATVASPVVPIVDRVVKAPIELTLDMIGSTFTSIVGLRAKVENILTDPRELVSWIDALLSAPEELFSKENKARLMEVIDLEELHLAAKNAELVKRAVPVDVRVKSL